MDANHTWNNHRKPFAINHIISVVALLFGLTITGCAAFVVGAGIGAASVAYVEGNLHAHVKADPRTVEKASVQTLKSMGIRVISSAGTSVDAEIKGQTATDKKVLIKAKSEEAGECSLTIRVGILGDESTSRRIFDGIKKRL